ncbi:hypothetical protein [Variovorax sp. PCZ-1]|uniref:hypothetical protein n=1 Tax=Variovorax sp. PCZ-1 TaxID=2835533 RepID=UPI001BCD65EE|nr:hypothetical protein [Variovorax sp. PCZ-1]MBS7808856.1 hypothetical protein [Variovorax sp. PCZ-1]
MGCKIFLSALIALFCFTDISMARGKGSGGGTVSVRGHFRKDGTYVAPHHRTAPDGNFQNNWRTQGNYNPYTGEDGKVVAPPSRTLGSSGTSYSAPVLGTDKPPVAPGLLTAPPAARSLMMPEPLPRELPSTQLQSDPLQLQPLGIDQLGSTNKSVAPIPQSNNSRSLTYAEQQKLRDVERAQFWAKQGYSFNPAYMSAYSMDQKVKDIERAKFWSAKGFNFNPEFMSAYSMDQKVKDIERAKHWQERGYTFNAEYMSAYSMDQKVRDIERARYWSTRGLNFDPNYMSAYSMDREAERKGLASR